MPDLPSGWVEVTTLKDEKVSINFGYVCMLREVTASVNGCEIAATKLGFSDSSSFNVRESIEQICESLHGQ